MHLSGETPVSKCAISIFNNLRRCVADGVVVVSLEASIVMDFYPPLPKDGVEEEEQEVGAVSCIQLIIV